MKRLFAYLALSLIVIASSQAQVTLMIKNQSGQPDASIWIQWTSQEDTGTNALNGISNGIRIAPSAFQNNAAGYRLDTFASPSAHFYEIDQFTMNGEGVQPVSRRIVLKGARGNPDAVANSVERI